MLMMENVCETSYMLQIFYIIKIAMQVICIVVPIILMIAASLDLVKNVSSANIGDMSGNYKSVIRRIVAAIFVFLVPTIVGFLCGVIGSKSFAYVDCYENSTREKIAYYKQKEESERLAEIARKQAERAAKIAAYNAKIKENETAPGINACTVSSSNANVYKKKYILKKLGKSDMKKVTNLNYSGGASIPQSFAFDGKNYIVVFVNSSETSASFQKYSVKGKKGKRINPGSVGHGNGATYNEKNNKFYVVSLNDAKAYRFDGKKLNNRKKVSLPAVASGIAYDSANDQYIIAKGTKVHVLNSNFKKKKTFKKKVDPLTPQDVGIYKGVALVVAWQKNTKKSRIDLYRTTDGAYLGSYSLNFGELESVLVKDDHLVILMNIQGSTNQDAIYETKDELNIFSGIDC